MTVIVGGEYVVRCVGRGVVLMSVVCCVYQRVGDSKVATFFLNFLSWRRFATLIDKRCDRPKLSNSITLIHYPPGTERYLLDEYLYTLLLFYGFRSGTLANLVEFTFHLPLHLKSSLGP